MSDSMSSSLYQRDLREKVQHMEKEKALLVEKEVTGHLS